MLVTLLPIVTLVSPLQPLKAEVPMLVTLLPIVTLVSPLQPLKAEVPILVPLVILTVKEEEPACFATVLAFVAEPEILVSPLQP